MSQWQKMIIDLKEQGLTQTQIATEINCSQNYVSNLENGLCGKRMGYDLLLTKGKVKADRKQLCA